MIPELTTLPIQKADRAEPSLLSVDDPSAAEEFLTTLAKLTAVAEAPVDTGDTSDDEMQGVVETEADDDSSTEELDTSALTPDSDGDEAAPGSTDLSEPNLPQSTDLIDPVVVAIGSQPAARPTADGSDAPVARRAAAPLNPQTLDAKTDTQPSNRQVTVSDIRSSTERKATAATQGSPATILTPTQNAPGAGDEAIQSTASRTGAAQTTAEPSKGAGPVASPITQATPNTLDQKQTPALPVERSKQFTLPLRADDAEQVLPPITKETTKAAAPDFRRAQTAMQYGAPVSAVQAFAQAQAKLATPLNETLHAASDLAVSISGTTSAEARVDAPRPVSIADLPSAIANKLRELIANPPPLRAGPQRTEITLSPAELGRVTFVIQKEDGVLSLQVLAERPETLELIRRHSDALERAASDGPVRLRLEQEGAASHRRDAPAEQSSADHDSTTKTTTETAEDRAATASQRPIWTNIGARLDMRL